MRSLFRESKFTDISENLLTCGAEKVLLGCTELELLTEENPFVINFIDSTKVHADTAWEISFGKKSLNS